MSLMATVQVGAINRAPAGNEMAKLKDPREKAQPGVDKREHKPRRQPPPTAATAPTDPWTSAAETCGPQSSKVMQLC